jgi:hypothetical protein
MTLARIVKRERRRLAETLGGAGVMAGIGAALAVIGASALVLGGGRWITRPAAPFIAWSAAIAAVVAIAVLTRRVTSRRASLAETARAIEHERGLRAGALRAASESADAGAFGRHASQLMAGQLGTMGRVLAPAALGSARRRFAMGLGVAAIAFAGAAVAARAAPDGWRAMLHPARAYAGTLLPAITIRDARVSVMRGDTVRVGIAAPGRTAITLASRSTGAAWRTAGVPVQDGRASVLLGPLDADLALVASDGRAVSDTVVIRVRDRAFVGDVGVEAVYPAYLHRASEALPAGEPVRVPRGTVLRLEARASTDLTRAGLTRDGGDTLRLAAHGRRASGRLDAGTGGTWRWFAAATDGPVTDVPPPLEVQTVPDAPPHAEILAPAADTLVASSGTITLRLAASDDHGVARVALHVRSESEGRTGAESELAIAQPGTPAWAGEIPFDLASRSLAPGDAVHLVLAVTDDSPWHQTAESRELVIRVPTLAEARAIARALGDSAAARTASAAASQKDLTQRTQEAARTRSDRSTDINGVRSGERPTSRTMSYETAERAAALAREQEQLAQRVRDAQQETKALERALKEAGALDTSLARQLRDAQKLLSEALTPEMARQLQAVMSSSKKLSPEETRRALEQLAQQQERLRAELERTAEMLKRAALEGAMQTLRDDAKELAAKSNAVADSLVRRDTSARTGAKSLSDQSKALADQVRQLGERLAKEHADVAAAKMPSAAQHAQKSSEKMATASGAPSDRAASEGREGADEMQKTAQDLADAREQQVREWKEGLTAELDRAAAEAMELSKTEADLSDRAAQGNDSTLRGEQSAVQQGVDKLSARLGKAAGQSAHVSPESQRALAEARTSVAEATRELAESRRGGREAAPELSQASQALASAASKMMSDRAQAAGGQSASGFAEMMEKLAQIAKQQGGLNSQAAGLLPAPGAPPGDVAASQARALANQQRALAKALEQSGAGDPARAAQMAREMRDIADQLDRGRVDPQLLQRQEKLFHRLLDSGLAMEKDEREDTGKRESRSATGDDAFAPANTNASGRAASRYGAPSWNELRTLTADERQAVLDYFNRLDRAPTP